MHRALFLVLMLAGCSMPNPGTTTDEHCGEVRRRSDGAWLLTTVEASSSLPARETRAESAVWRAWDAAYEAGGCGRTVREGDLVPWVGPVLHVGERDAVEVLLVNHTDANVIGGIWRLQLTTSGPVRATPEAWEGEVYDTAYAGFAVEMTGEGRASVLIHVTMPGGALILVKRIEYVIRDAVEGAPHRVVPERYGLPD